MELHGTRGREGVVIRGFGGSADGTRSSTEIENPITMEDFLSTPAADVVAFEPLHSCLTSTLRSPSSGGFLAWAS